MVAQVRGRPQSFKELLFEVDKSRLSVARELNGLLLRGLVSVIVLRFNGRDCPFYTLRKDVTVGVVKGPQLFTIEGVVVVPLD